MNSCIELDNRPKRSSLTHLHERTLFYEVYAEVVIFNDVP